MHHGAFVLQGILEKTLRDLGLEEEVIEDGLESSGSQPSTLDPKNGNGSILFTSSALLSIAYVRLCFDLGPNRLLESRNPHVIAFALAKAPDIEQTEALLSALLCSTHVLSFPV